MAAQTHKCVPLLPESMLSKRESTVCSPTPQQTLIAFSVCLGKRIAAHPLAVDTRMHADDDTHSQQRRGGGGMERGMGREKERERESGGAQRKMTV